MNIATGESFLCEVSSNILIRIHGNGNCVRSVRGIATPVVNPQLAIISVGEDNPFGHPSDEAMDRLEEKLGSENIYRTDEHGTIEFITDGAKLWVKVER